MTGKDVYAWRTKRLLSQADAAEMVGVSRQAWQHWELGDRDVPTPVETLLLLIDTTPWAKHAIARINRRRLEDNKRPHVARRA